jgi:inner membrane protein
VGSQGFAAHWHVLQLNRDYPQGWTGDAVGAAQIRNSAFGVDFYQPVDAYQRNYRANHYAFLFVALTFMVMFLLENVLARPLHPVQYAMTGAALAVFYLVLLAVSEHLSFDASYALAASALCALFGIYYGGVLHSRRAGLLVGLVSASCYGLLYLLILSEENALLFGALSLFAVLAAIMIATRRIDWYRLTAAR